MMKGKEKLSNKNALVHMTESAVLQGLNIVTQEFFVIGIAPLRKLAWTGL